MKKKIMFLVSSLRFGGAEKHTVTLINHLDDHKFEIHLCYLEKLVSLKDELASEKISSSYCCEKRGRFDLKILFKLRRYLDEVKPDIVICVDPYTGFLAQICRSVRKIKYKIVLIMHQTMMPSIFTDVIVRLIYRNMINKCDRVIFVCENQMKYWHDYYKIKPGLSSFIYNGIDEKFYDTQNVSTHEVRDIQETFGIRDNDIVIGICAVLRPEKKHIDLIRAVKILISELANLKLLIIGDGPERKVIEQFIHEKRLESNVLLTGFQKDIRPYMSVCNILAITSFTETFSISVLESMAMRKPVIASEVGGASEQIVDGETGVLFPTGDIVELVVKLKDALDLSKLKKMGEQSRLRLEQFFTVSKMIDEYNHLLELI